MPHWRIEQPQTLDLTGVRRLQVRLVAGQIDVVGTPAAEQAATQAADATDATAPAHLEVTDLEGPLDVTLEDGTLTITHERLTWGGLLDWSGGRKARAELSLSVPAGCPVELGVVSADATVSGLATDRVAVKSVSGDVTLDGVRADITAQTVSGDLESRELAGSLGFTTVSGDLTVVAGRSERVRAETVSGDVMLDLDLAPAGRIDVKSVSGDVTVRMPAETGLQVQAKTLSGSLDCAFPGVAVERKAASARLRGQIGDGKGSFTAKTVSGDVVLLQRHAVAESA